MLVRTGQQAEVLEQCFLQEGLPYRLMGHTSFLAARGVRQALAFGRYLLQPSDTLRLLQVLEIEAFQPGKTARAALRQQAQAGVVELQALAAAVPTAAAQLQTLAAAIERYRALLAEPPGVFFRRWQEEYGSLRTRTGAADASGGMGIAARAVRDHPPGPGCGLRIHPCQGQPPWRRSRS